MKESGIGAGKLHRHGKDSDPLIVPTAAAAVRLGLPERLRAATSAARCGCRRATRS